MKSCYRCGEGIADEIGSYELRQFNTFGKTCFYFHKGCMPVWVREGI